MDAAGNPVGPLVSVTLNLRGQMVSLKPRSLTGLDTAPAPQVLPSLKKKKKSKAMSELYFWYLRSMTGNLN